MKEGRSRIWINKFQSNLFIRIIGYWLFFLIALWNLSFLWQFVAASNEGVRGQYSHFNQNFYPMVIASLLIVPFLAWDAVRFSHRLVGPLLRFQKTFHAVTMGDPVEPIKLREQDFLLTMKDDLNTVLAELADKGVIQLTEPIPKPHRTTPKPLTGPDSRVDSALNCPVK